MGKAPEADESGRRGCNPRTLSQARETGWSAPKTLPPLTVAATLRPWPSMNMRGQQGPMVILRNPPRRGHPNPWN